jgi:serine phosphatase RsbU (regulator of sigma subunit)
MPNRLSISLPSSLDPRTLRGRVTLILNGTLVVLLGLFLLIDYQKDFADRLAMKRNALDEQARLIASGFEGQLVSGSESLQGLLGETHKLMNDDHHSEHWIAVRISQGWNSIGIPVREATSILSALDKVSRGQERIEQLFTGQFVVGRHVGANVEICVAETFQEVHAAIGADLYRHLWGVGMILLVGIVTLNIVMNVGLHTPLRNLGAAARSIGQGNFGSKITPIGLQELDLLAKAFNGMSDQLAAVEKNRAAQMRTARLIQEHLIPKTVSIEGLEVAYLFNPAEEIGGDYFDLLHIADGCTLLAIADASGHGVPAALVAAIIKVLLLDAVEHLSDPAEILTFIDQRMTALDIPEAFVTMQVVLFRPGNDYVEYASAGHVSAWIVEREAECHAMSSTGPLLGAGIELGWETERIQFRPGSRMTLLTDGVLEATNPSDEAFGEAQLCGVIRETLLTPTKEAPAAVYQELQRFVQGQEFLDDISVIMIDRPVILNRHK